MSSLVSSWHFETPQWAVQGDDAATWTLQHTQNPPMLQQHLDPVPESQSQALIECFIILSPFWAPGHKLC